MIKTDTYNDLSPKTLKQYQLKPGESVSFVTTKLRYDPMNKAWKIPTLWTVPNTDIIYDKEKGENVQIAAIKRKRPGRNGEEIELEEIRFERNNAGLLLLTGSNPQHRNLYTYLMLSNYREYEGRDPSLGEAMYKLQEPEKEAQEKNMARRLRTDAIKRVYDMTDQELRLFASAQGWKSNTNTEVLRDNLAALAEKEPKLILDMDTSDLRGTKSIVNRAIEQSIIKLDKRSNKFKWTATNDQIYHSPDKENAVENFASWLLQEKDRKLILDNIESKLEDL